MGPSPRLATFLVLLFTLACHNEASPKEGEASDKAKLCAGAGATLNPTSNECECGGGSKWNGSKCDQDQVVTDKTQGAEKAVATSSPSSPQLREVTPTTLIPEGHSKDGKKAGEKADKPHKNVGQHKTPRGSSVAATTGQDRKSACENAANHGKWDGDRSRCNCPTGRIWLKGQCALTSSLSSAKICESDFNGGNWDGAHKRCQCQQGRMWLNQSCMDPHALPSRSVCESEWNRGTWNNKRQVCSCPRGGSWNSKNLTCMSRTRAG